MTSLRQMALVCALFSCISVGAPAQEASLLRQPGAEMTFYSPEQHDLYDGHFVISAGRIHQVGSLDDEPGWNHIGNDASTAHAGRGNGED